MPDVTSTDAAAGFLGSDVVRARLKVMTPATPMPMPAKPIMAAPVKLLIEGRANAGKEKDSSHMIIPIKSMTMGGGMVNSNAFMALLELTLFNFCVASLATSKAERVQGINVTQRKQNRRPPALRGRRQKAQLIKAGLFVFCEFGYLFRFHPQSWRPKYRMLSRVRRHS